MATLFDAPSPTGRNDAKLFLNSRGQLLDRYGRHWGGSQIRKMAHDALPPDVHGAPGAGEKPDHERSAQEMKAEMQKLVDDYDLHDEVAAAVMALCEKHFPASASNKRGPGPDAVKGAGARDRHRVGRDAGPLSRHRAPGGRDDDDDEIDEKVREFLRGKGLDDESIEIAIKKAREDREAARDSRPQNAIHGGRGGRLSGVVKDAESPESLEVQYPGIGNVLRDTLGELDRERFAPLGGGSRPMLAGDAVICMDDAELAQLYPGIENVKAGF
jgi:hypothetical protein